MKAQTILNFDAKKRKSLEAATSKLFSDHFTRNNPFSMSQLLSNRNSRSFASGVSRERGNAMPTGKKTIKIHREVIKGHFVTENYAKKHPSTTVAETRPAPKQPKK